MGRRRKKEPSAPSRWLSREMGENTKGRWDSRPIGKHREAKRTGPSDASCFSSHAAFACKAFSILCLVPGGHCTNKHFKEAKRKE